MHLNGIENGTWETKMKMKYIFNKILTFLSFKLLSYKV